MPKKFTNASFVVNILKSILKREDIKEDVTTNELYKKLKNRG